MKHLFVNGCSFNRPRKKDGHSVQTYVGRIVAQHYGAKEHIFARGGRGNRRVCDTTKLFYETNKILKHNSVAIIQWTSAGRRDYPTNDGYKPIEGYNTTWRSWGTHEQLKFIHGLQGFDIDQDHSLMQLNDIIDLQNYFKIHGVKYVMYFGLISQINLKYQDHKTLYESIDWSKFYQPNTSHYEFCATNKLQISKNDQHPNLQGHEKWAQGLIKYIDNEII